MQISDGKKDWENIGTGWDRREVGRELEEDKAEFMSSGSSNLQAGAECEESDPLTTPCVVPRSSYVPRTHEQCVWHLYHDDV